MSNKSIIIEGTIVHKTNEAILIDNGDIQQWIPNSLVEYDDTILNHEINEFKIHEWFAIEKELV